MNRFAKNSEKYWRGLLKFENAHQQYNVHVARWSSISLIFWNQIYRKTSVARAATSYGTIHQSLKGKHKMQALHQSETRIQAEFVDSDLSSNPMRTTAVEDAHWRQYGKSRRRELLENDRRKGGSTFSLNSECSIQKYFAVADRVSFWKVCLNSSLVTSKAGFSPSLIDTPLPFHHYRHWNSLESCTGMKIAWNCSRNYGFKAIEWSASSAIAFLVTQTTIRKMLYSREIERRGT